MSTKITQREPTTSELVELSLADPKWLDASLEERRSMLLNCERICKELEPEYGVVMEPQHYHCNGVYAREILIPAGASVVGEIHLHAQINVVSKGKIVVATEEGVRVITAPSTFISPKGTKRVGHAIEDTVWTVFHATTSEDPEEIRKEFIAPNYEALDNRLEKT